MAQGHRFESEWPSEALSGARRSHSGRFGAVHQAVVGWPPFAFLSKTDSRSRGWIEHLAQTLLLDVASRVDHSWPRLSGRVTLPLSCPRSPPCCDPPAPPKGDGDRRCGEAAKGDRPTLATPTWLETGRAAEG
jgi:hypothetical protein